MTAAPWSSSSAGRQQPLARTRPRAWSGGIRSSHGSARVTCPAGGRALSGWPVPLWQQQKSSFGSALRLRRAAHKPAPRESGQEVLRVDPAACAWSRTTRHDGKDPQGFHVETTRANKDGREEAAGSLADFLAVCPARLAQSVSTWKPVIAAASLLSARQRWGEKWLPGDCCFHVETWNRTFVGSRERGPLQAADDHGQSQVVTTSAGRGICATLFLDIRVHPITLRAISFHC